jgi:hypothetical protein
MDHQVFISYASDKSDSAESKDRSKKSPWPVREIPNSK